MESCSACRSDGVFVASLVMFVQFRKGTPLKGFTFAFSVFMNLFLLLGHTCNVWSPALPAALVGSHRDTSWREPLCNHRAAGGVSGGECSQAGAARRPSCEPREGGSAGDSSSAGTLSFCQKCSAGQEAGDGHGGPLSGGKGNDKLFNVTRGTCLVELV